MGEIHFINLIFSDINKEASVLYFCCYSLIVVTAAHTHIQQM